MAFAERVGVLLTLLSLVVVSNLLAWLRKWPWNKGRIWTLVTLLVLAGVFYVLMRQLFATVSGQCFACALFLLPSLLALLYPYVEDYDVHSPPADPATVRRIRDRLNREAGYTETKNCSRCGKPVSLSARAGESCPHCGAYWSSESKIGPDTADLAERMANVGWASYISFAYLVAVLVVVAVVLSLWP